MEERHLVSFNALLREEMLDGEVFYTLKEAKIVIESWRRHYNAIRPHASLGYRAPSGGVCACACAHRVAGCAIPTSSTGHAPTGTETHHELTFKLDHAMGAGHIYLTHWGHARPYRARVPDLM